MIEVNLHPYGRDRDKDYWFFPKTRRERDLQKSLEREKRERPYMTKADVLELIPGFAEDRLPYVLIAKPLLIEGLAGGIKSMSDVEPQHDFIVPQNKKAEGVEKARKTAIVFNLEQAIIHMGRGAVVDYLKANMWRIQFSREEVAEWLPVAWSHKETQGKLTFMEAQGALGWTTERMAQHANALGVCALSDQRDSLGQSTAMLHAFFDEQNETGGPSHSDSVLIEMRKRTPHAQGIGELISLNVEHLFYDPDKVKQHTPVAVRNRRIRYAAAAALGVAVVGAGVIASGERDSEPTVAHASSDAEKGKKNPAQDMPSDLPPAKDPDPEPQTRPQNEPPQKPPAKVDAPAEPAPTTTSTATSRPADKPTTRPKPVPTPKPTPANPEPKVTPESTPADVPPDPAPTAPTSRPTSRPAAPTTQPTPAPTPRPTPAPVVPPLARVLQQVQGRMNPGGLNEQQARLQYQQWLYAPFRNQQEMQTRANHLRRLRRVQAALELNALQDDAQKRRVAQVLLALTDGTKTAQDETDRTQLVQSLTREWRIRSGDTLEQAEQQHEAALAVPSSHPERAKFIQQAEEKRRRMTIVTVLRGL